MEIKKNRFNIGPKTYNFIKFIATIASVIFLTILVLIILHLNNNILATKAEFDGTIYGLWVLGFLILGFYVGLRIHLMFVTKYKYKLKEKHLLWWAIGFYSVIPFITLVPAILSDVIDVANRSKAMTYWFIGILVLVLILNILASIFESFSRLGEQHFLFEQETENIEKGTVSEVGVQRTQEAQKILKQLKPATTSNVKKVAVKDKETLDDFFNKKDQEDD